MSSSGIANHRQVATVRMLSYALEIFRGNGVKWRAIQSAITRTEPKRELLTYPVFARDLLHAGRCTGAADLLREFAIVLNFRPPFIVEQNAGLVQRLGPNCTGSDDRRRVGAWARTQVAAAVTRTLLAAAGARPRAQLQCGRT